MVAASSLAHIGHDRRFGEPPDELWMLRVGEDWRIARMIRG